jgi:hypothetical protein
MSNPIISSTKDEEEKAHPNVDINTLEEKMDQLSDRIISLEKLIQRLASSQQQEQTNEPQSNSYYVGPPLQSLFGGKISYIVTPIFKPTNSYLNLTQQNIVEGLDRKNDFEAKQEDFSV